ncbi:MAG: hypothetical protein HC871_05895 [Rhizobiales bacterium]|nr:hypothetical protein [Hyphomicrobiales bacterium]
MALSFSLIEIMESFKAVAGTFTLRRDRAPIDSVSRLQHFVATRAAFVAQKTLYGYLQTRIGTRYARVVEDDPYRESINIAKFHVFAACLSDLAIHAAAHVLDGRPVADDVRRDLALGCFRRGFDDNSADMPGRFSPDEAEARFALRLTMTAWAGQALHRDNFRESPAALLRWAPIAPELKDEDAEIVANSIRFAWRDIREQFQKRLHADAVCADLAGSAASAMPVVRERGA